MSDDEFYAEVEKLLVSKGYWESYGWMNNITAKGIIITELRKKIKRHPLLFRMFFKIK